MNVRILSTTITPRSSWLAWALISLLGISATTNAQQQVEDDEYVVYYNALNSIFIQPEIANQYDLVRSRYRGLLNISVQRKQPGGGSKPVTAKLTGNVGPLGGSLIPLQFDLVNEGPAIYYLAQFHFKSGENQHFKIKVEPLPGYPPLVVKFSQSLYSD